MTHLLISSVIGDSYTVPKSIKIPPIKCIYIYKSLFTLVFLPSAVVSWNSWPNLNVTCVFLKVLSVLIVTSSPFMLMMVLGFAKLPSFLVANPTPMEHQEKSSHSLLIWQKVYGCIMQSFTPIISDILCTCTHI